MGCTLVVQLLICSAIIKNTVEPEFSTFASAFRAVGFGKGQAGLWGQASSEPCVPQCGSKGCLPNHPWHQHPL